MKFYSKRGHLISIESSKYINEIFFNIGKKDFEDIKDAFIFVMQEDKVLNTYTQEEVLSLEIDIVPNAKRKRMKYNFENFSDMYEYFKNENKFSKVIPYIGEDIK